MIKRISLLLVAMAVAVSCSSLPHLTSSSPLLLRKIHKESRTKRESKGRQTDKEKKRQNREQREMGEGCEEKKRDR